MPVEHTDATKQHFRTLIPADEGITVRPMFGSLGAFTNGRMYAAVFGDRFGIKVDPDAREEAAALPGAGPFGPETRPLAGWVSLPRDADDATISAWFTRAFTYVAGLPPKEPKPPRRPRSSRQPGARRA